MNPDKFLKELLSAVNVVTTISDAEKAGYDCGKNGANTTNCDFRLFARPELTKAWERGNARAMKEKKP